MPQYRYTAKTEEGKTVRGLADAPNEQALYANLRTQGLFLTDSRLAKGSDKTGCRFRTAQVANYCRELGTLLTAGVPLVRALAIMAEEEGLSAEVRKTYLAMQQDIRKGLPLSEAMANRGGAFPALLSGMIRSAENTGSIDKAALRMATHYEKEHRMDQQVLNTMMYPIILAVLVLAVVIFLLSFVVPQFQSLFDEMDSLPLPTVILLGISDFVKAHWLGLILGVVVAAVLIRVVLCIPAVRLRADWLKLRLPIIGRMQRKLVTARFARTLSNLYASGVPIVLSLQSGRDTVGNTYIASQFDGVLAMVQAGNPLSQALGSVDGFERKLVSSIRVGEETGKLESMLENISDNLDYEAEMATKRMMTLLEPALIVFMALIVGFVVIAVILPIYQSYATIGAGSGF